jgi:hypothetical protein
VPVADARAHERKVAHDALFEHVRRAPLNVRVSFFGEASATEPSAL